MNIALDLSQIKDAADKTSAQIWEQWIVAAVGQRQSAYSSRAMQRVLGAILGKLRQCDSDEIELTDVEAFVLRDIIASFAAPISANALLMQFYEKLQID